MSDKDNQQADGQSGASGPGAVVASAGVEGGSERPIVVCFCGSSKWPEVHMRAMMQETLSGKIVVPMGLYGHADFPAGARAATNDGDEAMEVKQMLDRLHFAKIDLSDEILVLSVGGYVGSSTRREIAYAFATGKRVRWFDGGEVTAALQNGAGGIIDDRTGAHCGALPLIADRPRSNDA